MSDKPLGADAAAVETARSAGPVGTGKHTPGPWYADAYGDDCDGIGVCAKGKGIVADVDSDYCDTDEMHANAHLIAAAPDLLEALKAIRGIAASSAKVSHFMDGLPEEITGRPNPRRDTATAEDTLLAQIDAAIAKAEGRS